MLSFLQPFPDIHVVKPDNSASGRWAGAFILNNVSVLRLARELRLPTVRDASLLSQWFVI